MGNFLFGFTLHQAHYIFIRATNDLVYYREGGRQCCFISLSVSVYSLQEGLIADTETLSISNLPFAVHWIAESSKAVDLPRH